MLPGKIEISLTAINENPECGMVFTDAYRINECGELFPGTLLQDYDGLHSLIKNKNESDIAVITSDDAFSLLFEENFIPTSSVILRRNILDHTGFFDETLVNGDDRDMWFRLTCKYDICFVNNPLHQYRIRTGSVSKRGILTAYNRVKVLKKQLEKPLTNDLGKKAKNLIAKNYNCIGYYFREQGDMSKAREYYFQSIKTSRNLIALKGILVSMLGADVYLMLRKFKKNLRMGRSMCGACRTTFVRARKVHTLTADNGKEFTQHKTIAESLEAEFYFAHPYASWERVTNKNMNGLIRQYFPKHRDFKTVTDEEIQRTIDRLNNRPRKCLGYRTPNEVFFDKSPVTLAS